MTYSSRTRVGRRHLTRTLEHLLEERGLSVLQQSQVLVGHAVLVFIHKALGLVLDIMSIVHHSKGIV